MKRSLAAIFVIGLLTYAAAQTYPGGGSGGGPVTFTNVTANNLNLPDTAAGPVGFINFGGARFVHDTNAISNTFIGHNSANLTTTTTNSVAVGESAGLALAAGASNTFIGRFAGGGITSGSNNVAVGATALSAGANATLGSTAVGVNALAAATGASNTGVGLTACADVAAGTANTCLGQNTGRGVTSGSNNTILGAGVTGLAAGLANSIVLAIGGGTIEADWAKTTAGTWSFNGAVAATLASAVGTNVVCNTPGTMTALTVQVSATGCAASSARFKDAITAIDREKAFETILALDPVSYYYKPEFNMGSDRHIGFTAEQVGSVDPSLITFESDGVTPHAVKYNEMAPLFAAAIQQLKSDNDSLRAEIEDVKRRTR